MTNLNHDFLYIYVYLSVIALSSLQHAVSTTHSQMASARPRLRCIQHRPSPTSLVIPTLPPASARHDDIYHRPTIDRLHHLAMARARRHGTRIPCLALTTYHTILFVYCISNMHRITNRFQTEMKNFVYLSTE
jgi:hypothetical protein